MKKLISSIMAFTVFFSCAGCSKNGAEKAAKPSNVTASALSGAAYLRSLAEKPDDMSIIYGMLPYSGGERFMLFGTGTDGLGFVTCSADFSSFNPVDFGKLDYGNSYSLDASEDGGIVQLVNHVDYGDLPEPDIYAEDYDEAVYDAAATYDLILNKYAPDGSPVFSNVLDSNVGIGSKRVSVRNIIAGTDSAIININDEYSLISCDGKLIKKFSDTEIKAWGKDKNGRFVCACQPEEEKLIIKSIDPKTGELKENTVTYTFSETVRNKITAGSGEYLMFLSSNTTIFGIKESDMSIEPIFSYQAAGLNPNEAGDYTLCSDGSLLFLDTDYTDYVTKIRKYTPCSPSDIENIPTLTIGRVNFDYMLDDYIKKLNDTQNKFRIEIKEYTCNDNNEFTGLAEDVAKGELPDILVLDDSDQISREYFESLGCLCDLYEFIDTDTELSRDSFVPNILKICETNGKLYSIPNIFRIDAGEVIKTKFADNIDGWTPADRLEFYKNPPEGIKPNKYESDSQYDRFLTVCNIGEFIDKSNATCHFDDGVFADILEYSFDAPSEPNYYYFEPDTPEFDEYIYYWDNNYREDRTPIMNMTFASYDSYINNTKGDFGGEPLTFLKDKPTVEFENGYYAINAASANKELAWEFLREIFTDSFYIDKYNGGKCSWAGFPITVSGLAIRAEMDNSSGPGKPNETSYWYCGNEIIPIGLVEQSDIDAVNSMIYSIEERSPVSGSGIPTSIENEIIYAEIDRFFAGECTADECAEIIQNRVSTYLSEQS